MALMESLGPTHHLIYPPTDEQLTKMGFIDSSTLALVVPRNLLSLTNQ
jgi:hypothetical protein